MKNKELRFIAEIGIFTALGLVFGLCGGVVLEFHFPERRIDIDRDGADFYHRLPLGA